MIEVIFHSLFVKNTTRSYELPDDRARLLEELARELEKISVEVN